MALPGAAARRRDPRGDAPQAVTQARHPHRAGRGAAAIELAKTLPAAILADLLGFDSGTAEDWTRLASGEWARYAAAR